MFQYNGSRYGLLVTTLGSQRIRLEFEGVVTNRLLTAQGAFLGFLLLGVQNLMAKLSTSDSDHCVRQVLGCWWTYQNPGNLDTKPCKIQEYRQLSVGFRVFSVERPISRMLLVQISGR